MKSIFRLLPMLLFCALAGSVLYTCGENDEREAVRASLGEPDEILTQGADPFWRESWFYCDQGLEYQFRRTGGCGAPQDVYLYGRFRVFCTPVDDSTDGNQINSKPLAPPEQLPPLPGPVF